MNRWLKIFALGACWVIGANRSLADDKYQLTEAEKRFLGKDYQRYQNAYRAPKTKYSDYRSFKTMTNLADRPVINLPVSPSPVPGLKVSPLPDVPPLAVPAKTVAPRPLVSVPVAPPVSPAPFPETSPAPETVRVGTQIPGAPKPLLEKPGATPGDTKKTAPAGNLASSSEKEEEIKSIQSLIDQIRKEVGKKAP